ncbi:MAG: sialidase family protein [Sandaracinaceae bacterium]
MASLVLALVGCSDAAGPTTFVVAGVHTVSPEASPFADCTADLDPGMDWHAGRVHPWIAVDPNDPQRIAAVYAQDVYDVGEQPQDNRGLVVASSLDGGVTWEATVVPGITRCADGAWDQVRHAWMTAGSNGDLYVLAQPAMGWVRWAEGAPTAAHVVARSTDWGRTWGTPVEVVRVPESEPGYPSYGVLSAHPTEACTLYATFTRYVGVGWFGSLELARSTDCGATWETPQVVSGVRRQSRFPHAAQVRVLADGTLVSLHTAGDTLVAQRSVDGGVTWSSPPVQFGTDVREWIPMPGPSDFAGRVDSGPMEVAHDPATDRLYAVWAERLEADRGLGVAFVESTDGGLTWSTPVLIDGVPAHDDMRMGQALMPAVAVASNGTVGVLYLSFERDVVEDAATHMDAWLTTCRPGDVCTQASAWSARPLRLTPASFDMRHAAYVEACADGAAPAECHWYYIAFHLGLEGWGDGFAAVLPVPDDAGDRIQVITVEPE